MSLANSERVIENQSSGRTVPLYDQANPKAQRVRVQLGEGPPPPAPSYDFTAIARALWGDR